MADSQKDSPAQSSPKPPPLLKPELARAAFANTWNFETDSEAVVTFSSELDSGNLHNVKQSTEDRSHFLLWIRRDCQGTEFEKDLRTWFYFAVRCTKKDTKIKITIQNMNGHKGLLNNGYRPVFCVGDPRPRRKREPRTSKKKPAHSWRRLPVQQDHGVHKKLPDGSAVARWMTWTHEFSALFQPVFFAFCYPYPLTDVLGHVEEVRDLVEEQLRQKAVGAGAEGSIQNPDTPPPSLLVPPDMYFHVNEVVKSMNNRPMHMVTVSSMLGISDENDLESDLPDEPNLFPGGPGSMPRHFRNSPKRVCFISSRVHPGETPAAFIFEGFLDFITDPIDPRAALLRDLYVFKLVPCLNPDGTVEGHYRSSARGENLNRFYMDPSPEHHPTIYASKCICRHYTDQNRLFMFLDMHAHANRKGMFCFGNQVPELEVQVQNELFPWLVALNSPHMDVLQCDFSVKNLKTKSRHDTGVSDKKGAGRATMYHELGLVHSYTLESHYLTGVVHKVTDTASGKKKRKKKRSEKTVDVGEQHDKSSVEAAVSKVGGGQCDPLTDCAAASVESDPAQVESESKQQQQQLTDSAKAPKQTVVASKDPLSPKHPAGSGSRKGAIFETDDWRYLGKSAAIALLDLLDSNPHSRLPTSSWKSLDGLRQRIRRKLELKDPYRKPVAGRPKKPKAKDPPRAAGAAVPVKSVELDLNECVGNGSAAAAPPPAQKLAQAQPLSPLPPAAKSLPNKDLKVRTGHTTRSLSPGGLVGMALSPSAAGAGIRAAANLKAGNNNTLTIGFGAEASCGGHSDSGDELEPSPANGYDSAGDI